MFPGSILARRPRLNIPSGTGSTLPGCGVDDRSRCPRRAAAGGEQHARIVKDWKRLERSGRYPMRDCHIRGDWLLIYRINATPQGEEIVFVRTGTHAELFE